MKHIFDLKGKFIDALDKMLNDWKYEDLNGLRQELREDSHRGLLSDSELVNIHQRIDDLNEKDMYENYKVWDIAENIKASKTIIFKREQALVFWDFAVKKKVSIDFPYKLPYPSILIQFDNLIELRLKTETGSPETPEMLLKVLSVIKISLDEQNPEASETWARYFIVRNG